MTQTDASSRPDRIRTLNDAFRQTFVGGTVLLTDGVMALAAEPRRSLLAAIRAFTAFDDGNDPYGKHDFGAVDIEGERFFFKIDAYDRSMEAGSPDPSDPAVTSRVLTIMRADEY